MLRMMWHAPLGPATAPLVPVFLGIDRVPPEYGRRRHLGRGESTRFVDRTSEVTGEDTISKVPQGVVSTRAAIAVFKRLMHLAFKAGSPESRRSRRIGDASSAAWQRNSTMSRAAPRS